MDPSILSRLPQVTDAQELSRIGGDLLDMYLAPYQVVPTPQERDHGIDGTVNIVGSAPGEATLHYTGRAFQYQLKTTVADPARPHHVTVETNHLLLWLTSTLPIVLFLVEVRPDRLSGEVYWRCLDPIFHQWLTIERAAWRDQVTVSIPFASDDAFNRSDRALFESTLQSWRTPL